MFPVIFKRENLVYGSLYANTNKIEDLSKEGNNGKTILKNEMQKHFVNIF